MNNDTATYILSEEKEAPQKRLGVFQGYDSVLETAKEQAFIRYKLLSFRKILDEQRLGPPRMVTPNDWLRDRMDLEEMV